MGKVCYSLELFNIHHIAFFWLQSGTNMKKLSSKANTCFEVMISLMMVTKDLICCRISFNIRNHRYVKMNKKVAYVMVANVLILGFLSKKSDV